MAVYECGRQGSMAGAVQRYLSFVGVVAPLLGGCAGIANPYISIVPRPAAPQYASAACQSSEADPALRHLCEEQQLRTQILGGKPPSPYQDSQVKYCITLEDSADWTSCYRIISERLGSAAADGIQRDRTERQQKLKVQETARDIEHKRKQAEWVKHRHWATATGMSVVNGALVCPDFQTFQSVFDALVSSWEDAAADRMTRGQSRLMRQPMPEPNLEVYGCALVPTGTRVLVEAANVVPIITAEVNGKSIKGVTHSGMIKFDEKAP